jgi:hypothetical protein
VREACKHVLSPVRPVCKQVRPPRPSLCQIRFAQPHAQLLVNPATRRAVSGLWELLERAQFPVAEALNHAQSSVSLQPVKCNRTAAAVQRNQPHRRRATHNHAVGFLVPSLHAPPLVALDLTHVQSHAPMVRTSSATLIAPPSLGQ